MLINLLWLKGFSWIVVIYPVMDDLIFVSLLQHKVLNRFLRS